MTMSSVLAIHGGEKTVTQDQREALTWPQFTEEDFTEVKRVMQMPDYSFYEETYKLEEELKDYYGSKYILAHNNGTSAIHSALFGIGVGPGDEVITTSYTYWASAMPVLACNAISVFADINPDTLNIDPKEIEKKISPQTKAIIVVHLCGMPCAMEEIMNIARRYNLKVIEDFAHAHGAEYRGKKIGTIGDIGCSSFQATKLLPAIEGGILITDNQEYYERAVALGHYERIPTLPAESKYRKFHPTGYGYKYRMHPLSSAIARVQFKHLENRNTPRTKNLDYLNSELGKIRGIEIIKTPTDVKRAYYCYRVKYNSEQLEGLERNKFIAALQAEGVEGTTERYVLLHIQPIFQERNMWGEGCPWSCPSVKNHITYKRGDLPSSEQAIEEVLVLPTFPQANKKLLDQYIQAFKKVTEHIEEAKKIKETQIEEKPDMNWGRMQQQMPKTR